MTNIEAIEVFGLKEEYEKLKAASFKKIEESFDLSPDDINKLGFQSHQSYIEYLSTKYFMLIYEILIKAHRLAESSIKYLDSSLDKEP